MGRPSRCQYYLPPHQGGLDLPCAVLEFGLIPWTREVLVELNDPTEWGLMARAMLDTELGKVTNGEVSAATAVQRLRQSHISRLCKALGGYGFYIRDLAHKLHSRTMDLLGYNVLYHRRPSGG